MTAPSATSVSYTHLDTQSGAPRRRDRFARVIVGVRGDGGDDRLQRRQPERQMPGVMLDHDAGKALERPEHRAMQHHRRHLARMFVDVEGAEPARHIEIDLHGAALPVAANSVAQNVFELGAVERAFALVERPRPAGSFQRRHQRGFGLVPDGVPVSYTHLDVYKRQLENYIRRRQTEAGYAEVNAPQLIDSSLWVASGHMATFREGMFLVQPREEDERTFVIKPMNCPGHIQICLLYTSHARQPFPLTDACGRSDMIPLAPSPVGLSLIHI